MMTKGSGWCNCKTTFWNIVVTGGGSRGLENPKVTVTIDVGKQTDLGNYRPVNLTLIPVTVMEQIPLGIISKNIKDKNAIGSSQQRFIKVKSCLINLVAFYDKMLSSVDEGRAVGTVYLHLSKAFNTLP